MNRKIFFIAVLAAAFVVGCVETDDEDPSPDENPEQTGVELTVDFVGDTDVAGFEYVITECSAGNDIKGAEPVRQVTKDLEDLSLPGMIPEFENDPFDAHSTHLFADYYTSLPAGCYDVKVQPITKNGDPSEDCAKATARDVEVEDGKTTEVLLISQCDGAGKGGLDVVAALNHAPIIENLKFEKFNQECDRVKICATASDPDGDPLEFEWKKISGPELLEGLTPKEDKSISCSGDDSCQFSDYDDYFVEGHDQVKSCVEMRLGEVGDYKFKLSVFDLYWYDGELVRFDNSSASIKFPVYAGTNSEVECPPKDENGDKLY